MIKIENEYYIPMFLGILSIGILYLENIINNKKKNLDNFLKLLIIVIVTSVLTIYLCKTVVVSNIKITEDILTGDPNF